MSYHHMGWGKKKSNFGNSWIQAHKGKGKAKVSMFNQIPRHEDVSSL
jgi:hypothetical protein